MLPVELPIQANTNKPFPKRQILDSSKLKEFADNKFKFDENGRKLQTGRKHWEKEKLLVTSNFSFSHSVFERHRSTADM